MNAVQWLQQAAKVPVNGVDVCINRSIKVTLIILCSIIAQY